MPTLTERSQGVKAQLPTKVDDRHVTRGLHAAYSRARLEEVIRAVAEDALIPSQIDVVPWRDEPPFEAELREAVSDIAHMANGLLAERLTMLLETAPPTLAGRLPRAGRIPELS